MHSLNAKKKLYTKQVCSIKNLVLIVCVCVCREIKFHNLHSINVTLYSNCICFNLFVIQTNEVILLERFVSLLIIWLGEKYIKNECWKKEK